VGEHRQAVECNNGQTNDGVGMAHDDDSYSYCSCTDQIFPAEIVNSDDMRMNFSMQATSIVRVAFVARGGAIFCWLPALCSIDRQSAQSRDA
jgi:hypothetical protein